VAGLTRRLGDFPLAGAVHPELAPERYRFAGVNGFPYIAVYDASQGPPIILRILHGARDLPEILRDL